MARVIRNQKKSNMLLFDLKLINKVADLFKDRAEKCCHIKNRRGIKMKKLFIFLVFSLGIIFSISMCLKNVDADQVLQYGYIIVENEEKIDVEGIKIDLYRQTSSESVDSYISVYHNQFVESLSVSPEGEFTFSCTEGGYLEIDLDTLPKGYGALRKIVDARLDYNFSLYAIEQCQIEYKEEEISIHLLNAKGDQIYANAEYYIENIEKDNNGDASALVKVEANDVIFYQQVPIENENVYAHFQQMLFSCISDDNMDTATLSEWKPQIICESNETIQVNEHIIKYKMVTTYDRYYNNDYTITKDAIDEKEKFLKQEIQTVFNYLYSKGYQLQELATPYFAHFEVNYLMGTGDSRVDTISSNDYTYNIHLDISVRNDSIAMVKAKIFHEIYHAITRNITSDKIARDNKIDEGLTTFMELCYMGVDNNYLYLGNNHYCFFKESDFIYSQIVEVNTSETFDEMKRLHSFIYNYRDNAFMYHNSQYNYQLFIPSTGRVTFSYENCVVYLIFYKVCGNAGMFHHAIMSMLNTIQTMNYRDDIKMLSFRHILEYYNLHSNNDMTIVQFEEQVANILFCPEKLCDVLRDDFTQFDDTNNIWLHKKVMPCYVYRDKVNYKLSDGAISLFQFAISSSKNKVGITKISVDSDIQIRLLNQKLEVIYSTIDKNCTLVIDENDSIEQYYIEFISPIAQNQINIQYQTYDKFADGSYKIEQDKLSSNVAQILYKPKVTTIYTISSLMSELTTGDIVNGEVDITVYQASSGRTIASVMNYANRTTSYAFYLNANDYYIVNIEVKNTNVLPLIHIDNYYDQDVTFITNYTIFEQEGMNLKGITQLHFKGYGKYNIALDYRPEPFTVSFETFQVKLMKQSYNGLVEIYTGNISTYSKSIITRCDLKNDDIIYVLYDNPCAAGKILIEAARYNHMDKVFSITPDKNDADINLMGTEVKLNNGQRESAVCTTGFTRCLFPDMSAPSLLRENYYWFSDNDNIVSVSQFGTIQAKCLGVARIYCVYKYDYEYFGEICITVHNDSNTNIVDLSYGLDCRGNASPSGTEVISGKGEIIPVNQYNSDTILSVHQNHTRLICIGTDSPASYLQDFLWKSSDDSKVSVTSFGTIIGMNPTDEDDYVVITGIYKYNLRYRVQLKICCYE